MMHPEQKANLARKLTGALRQAPDNPELFANILRRSLRSNDLHITEVAIAIGDTTNRLAEQLQEARKNAQPTFDNLLDLARTKLNLGRSSDRALAEALGVSASIVSRQRQLGRVPRVWFEKIHALPDLGETHSRVDPETKHAIEILAENGYSPEAIYGLFRRVRTTRAGIQQISTIVHGEQGYLNKGELAEMCRALFGNEPTSARRFQIWLSTHARMDIRQVDVHGGLNPRQIERLRSRFKRELELRRSDLNYKDAASAAEMISRPLRSNPSRRLELPDNIARRLRAKLALIFGDELESRFSTRLAQLTGLDDRHTLDLLKGANGVSDDWWKFLDAVESSVLSKPRELALEFPTARTRVSDG